MFGFVAVVSFLGAILSLFPLKPTLPDAWHKI
jgi:hypothetical protein